MNKIFYFSLFLTYILFSCSFIDTNTNNPVIMFDSLVIYNKDFNSEKCALAIDSDSSVILGKADSNSDLIVSSYFSNSIVLLSPSKDSVISEGNSKQTGILDVGTYKYENAPTEGFYDMEFINSNHYYFIKTENDKYLRLYIYSYSQDSLILSVELLSDTGTFFGE